MQKSPSDKPSGGFFLAIAITTLTREGGGGWDGQDMSPPSGGQSCLVVGLPGSSRTPDPSRGVSPVPNL